MVNKIGNLISTLFQGRNSNVDPICIINSFNVYPTSGDHFRRWFNVELQSLTFVLQMFEALNLYNLIPPIFERISYSAFKILYWLISLTWSHLQELGYTILLHNSILLVKMVWQLPCCRRHFHFKWINLPILHPTLFHKRDSSPPTPEKKTTRKRRWKPASVELWILEVVKI
jgi:hypothetical protein